MEKQRLQNLVEEYVNEAIDTSESGSWVWSAGEVENYLQSTLTEEDMQTLEDLLHNDQRIAYCEVYTDATGQVVIDCNFYLDYLRMA